MGNVFPDVEVCLKKIAILHNKIISLFLSKVYVAFSRFYMSA